METSRLTLVPPKEYLGRAYIFSLFPFPMAVTRPAMPYMTIPACPEGAPWIRYEVTDRIIPTEKGTGEDGPGAYINTITPARQLAHDLIHDCLGMGLFVGEGEEPTAEELAKAKADLAAYARKSVNEGHEIFQRWKHSRFISKHSVWGAKFLNEQPEWAFQNTEALIKCEDCKKAIPADAAVCGECGSVVDWDRAAAGNIDLLERGVKQGLVNLDRVKQIIAERRVKRLQAAQVKPWEPTPEELGEDALTPEEAALAPPADPEVAQRAANTGKRVGRAG